MLSWSAASSVQSDDNNNKCYKTKNLKIKFKESFSNNAFNSTITEAKSKINREENYASRKFMMS